MEEIEEALSSLMLVPRVDPYIDSDPKTPVYKKNGEYTAASARIIGEYLGYQVVPADALKANPPMKPGD